jgi:hypothetical protein
MTDVSLLASGVSTMAAPAAVMLSHGGARLTAPIAAAGQAAQR